MLELAEVRFAPSPGTPLCRGTRCPADPRSTCPRGRGAVLGRRLPAQPFAVPSSPISAEAAGGTTPLDPGTMPNSCQMSLPSFFVGVHLLGPKQLDSPGIHVVPLMHLAHNQFNSTAGAGHSSWCSLPGVQPQRPELRRAVCFPRPRRWPRHLCNTQHPRCPMLLRCLDVAPTANLSGAMPYSRTTPWIGRSPCSPTVRNKDSDPKPGKTTRHVKNKITLNAGE